MFGVTLFYVYLHKTYNKQTMKIPIIFKTLKVPVPLFKAIDKQAAKEKMTFHGYLINLLKKIHKVK